MLKSLLLAGFTWRCIYCIKEWRRKCYLLGKLPGPEPASPWLLHLKNVLNYPKVPGRNDFHSWGLFTEFVEQHHESSGATTFSFFSPFRLPFISHTIFFLTDSELIRKAVNHPKLQAKGETYKILLPITEGSIMVATGHDWKRMRKLSSKAFSHDAMEKMTSVVRNIMRSKIYPILDEYQIGNAEVDVVSLMSRMALDAVGIVAFSYNLGALDELVLAQRDSSCSASSVVLVVKNGNIEKETSLQNLFEEVFEDLQKFARFGPLQRVLKISNLRYRENVQSLNNKILSIVEARRKAARNRRNGKSFKGKDLLSYLFEEDENGVPILSTEELVVNTKLFILAGHDTTATTLVFALYELSRKPHVILKLRNEIDPLFKKRENPPKYSQLRSCDYLEAVIRETQRLHAAVIYSPQSHKLTVSSNVMKYTVVAMMNTSQPK